MPYFQSTYCTYSNLHFGYNILSSSSGVKQGDPLGPLLFCLAIHPILLQIREMIPSLKKIAYMDDVVLIGDLNIVKQATVCFKDLFTKIGLRLNLLKCVLLSNSPVSTIIDDIEIPAKLYSIDAIRHLGSFLGNNDEITTKLASMGLTRGDLVVPGLNGSFTILDAMSIDPCNSSNEHLINSEVNNPLLAGEKYKIAKYAKLISSVNENSHTQYNLCPFVFSLLESLGKAAMAFLEDFVVVVKERTGRIFNRVYWQNRIVFSIFKGMVKLISDSLSPFGKFCESLAINRCDVGDAGFQDVEFKLCISYLLLNKNK
ncbi:hypothetical protein P9112_011515 [Eukaryota sp. TZLM1-RC]